MQKESAFFSAPSSRMSLSNLSPKLSPTKTKLINTNGSPLTKYHTPKSSQQQSPAQGLSPGIKTPKSQYEGSPTLFKVKSPLTNLKLSALQETSLLSPFLQTEPSTSRSITGTTGFETIESNRNSSNYNQSTASESAFGLRNSSIENFKPSKYKETHDKLRKTQIIQRTAQPTEAQKRQKSMDTMSSNGVNILGGATKTKLIKVIAPPNMKIDTAKLLTRQLPNVKSGVQTPTKNFILPTPKLHPLSTRAGYLKKEFLTQADSANSTPRRPEGENPGIIRGISRTLSAKNDIVVTSHDDLDIKSASENSEKEDYQPEQELKPEVQDLLVAKKRESNIMTKQLELKYGIKMANDDSSFTSEDNSLEENQEMKPIGELKISQLDNAQSVCFDALGENKTGSKMRDFLIKRHEVKSARGTRRVNSMAPGKEDNQGARKEKRIKTMIGNEDYWGNKLQTEEVKREEDLFIGGNTDYFQLNTEHNKYSDLFNFCNDDIASLQTKPKKKEKKSWDDNKLSEDEYKPMVVWFGTGGRIIQPKYMKSMGSMCYTEFWPKHLSMKIQKMVVKEGDCLKITNTGRNDETVYRPVKWNSEDGVKKRVDKNVQAMKGGHERQVGMAKEKNKMRDQTRRKK